MTKLLDFYHSARKARATSLFIVANIAVYLILGAIDTRAFESLDHNSFLIHWGADVPVLTLSGEFWRLGSSMFLHVNLLHIAMNMVALWSLGRILEAWIGSTRFVILYLLSGLAGSMTSVVWYQGALMISCGASGAIMGLFGALLAFALIAGKRSGLQLQGLFFNLLLIFGIGSVASVDNAAHIGGLVTGAVMMLLWLLAQRSSAPFRQALLALFLLLPAAGIGLAYSHYYSHDAAAQLKTARLLRVLAHIGLEGDSAQYMGMAAVQQCIDNTLSDPAVPVSQLQKCAPPVKDASTFVQRAGPALLQQCRHHVAGLQAAYTQPAETRALAVIDDYCQTQLQAFDIVFGQTVTDFTPAHYQQANITLFNMLDAARHGAQHPELASAAEAYQRMVDRMDELSFAVAKAEECPYTSCRRSWSD